MKKYTKLMLILMVMVFALAGCSSPDNDAADTTGPVDIESLTTMGEVIALQTEETQRGVGNGKAIIAFKYDDSYYRVTASLTDEEEQAYMNVDILQDGADEKQDEILAPVEIASIENLTDQILSQEDLDALAGKTGQEMVDMGWIYQGSYYTDGDDMVAYMDFGPFDYLVTFDGGAQGSDDIEYSVEDNTSDKGVKSIEFNSLGNATDTF